MRVARKPRHLRREPKSPKTKNAPRRGVPVPHASHHATDMSASSTSRVSCSAADGVAATTAVAAAATTTATTAAAIDATAAPTVSERRRTISVPVLLPRADPKPTLPAVTTTAATTAASAAAAASLEEHESVPDERGGTTKPSPTIKASDNMSPTLVVRVGRSLFELNDHDLQREPDSLFASCRSTRMQTITSEHHQHTTLLSLDDYISASASVTEDSLLEVVKYCQTGHLPAFTRVTKSSTQNVTQSMQWSHLYEAATACRCTVLLQKLFPESHLVWQWYYQKEKKTGSASATGHEITGLTAVAAATTVAAASAATTTASEADTVEPVRGHKHRKAKSKGATDLKIDLPADTPELCREFHEFAKSIQQRLDIQQSLAFGRSPRAQSLDMVNALLTPVWPVNDNNNDDKDGTTPTTDSTNTTDWTWKGDDPIPLAHIGYPSQALTPKTDLVVVNHPTRHISTRVLTPQQFIVQFHLYTLGLFEGFDLAANSMCITGLSPLIALIPHSTIQEFPLTAETGRRLSNALAYLRAKIIPDNEPGFVRRAEPGLIPLRQITLRIGKQQKATSKKRVAAAEFSHLTMNRDRSKSPIRKSTESCSSTKTKNRAPMPREKSRDTYDFNRWDDVLRYATRSIEALHSAEFAGVTHRFMMSARYVEDCSKSIRDSLKEHITCGTWHLREAINIRLISRGDSANDAERAVQSIRTLYRHLRSRLPSTEPIVMQRGVSSVCFIPPFPYPPIVVELVLAPSLHHIFVECNSFTQILLSTLPSLGIPEHAAESSLGLYVTSLARWCCERRVLWPMPSRSERRWWLNGWKIILPGFSPSTHTLQAELRAYLKSFNAAVPTSMLNLWIRERACQTSVMQTRDDLETLLATNNWSSYYDWSAGANQWLRCLRLIKSIPKSIEFHLSSLTDCVMCPFMRLFEHETAVAKRLVRPPIQSLAITPNAMPSDAAVGTRMRTAEEPIMVTFETPRSELETLVLRVPKMIWADNEISDSEPDSDHDGCNCASNRESNIALRTMSRFLALPLGSVQTVAFWSDRNESVEIDPKSVEWMLGVDDNDGHDPAHAPLPRQMEAEYVPDTRFRSRSRSRSRSQSPFSNL